MAAATIEAQVLHGPTGAPIYASAEGGLIWNRSDDELGVKRVPVPASIPGSNYSNYKSLQLVVLVVGTTIISNLAYRRNSVEPSGARFFALATAPTVYEQCTGDAGSQGNRPSDSVAPLTDSPEPNVPTGYVAIQSFATAYDLDDYPTTSTGPKGKILQAICGLSHLYGGEPSAAEAAPGIVMSYDEA